MGRPKKQESEFVTKQVMYDYARQYSVKFTGLVLVYALITLMILGGTLAFFYGAGVENTFVCGVFTTVSTISIIIAVGVLWVYCFREDLKKIKVKE